MKKNEQPINGLVSDEKIQQWKNQHRKVYSITIEDGENIVGYFKRPDMATLSAVNAISKTDEVKAANILFDNCWLGGSELVREDAVVKMGMMSKLNDMMTLSGSALKNL
ncbi:MAG: hypothetical protein RBR89_06085 [Candidatus Bipolaricaulis sp.]|nr:hypothetical protein [Candidatus Bipolaricaulis sp.]